MNPNERNEWSAKKADILEGTDRYRRVQSSLVTKGSQHDVLLEEETL